MFRLTATVIGLTFQLVSYATPDWSSTAELPGEARCEEIHGHEVCLTNQNRKNIYDLDESDFEELTTLGAKLALNYPVEITRLKLPTESMEKFFDANDSSPLRRFIFKIAKSLSKFKTFDDIFKWVGLHEYPKNISELGPNKIPDMKDLEEHRMGVSVFHQNSHQSTSFSCAACHSSDLFGVKVLGLTNRFPRANETFILGKEVLTKTPTLAFNLLVGPSKHDLDLFKEAKDAIKYVGVKKPLTLGLDTSLAQVGMSLAMREKDEYATINPRMRARYSQLTQTPADSKPAVWWNLKYKTKWLSDGSIQSGNPIHTNFLWNEIGRGVDLKELETWLTTNKNKVKALTSFVFSTEAPKYNDFFPRKINISKAKRGEELFLQNCKGCHGVYEKGWAQENADQFSYEELIATTDVWYHKQTKVVDIGTDPYRHEGMEYFYKDLNRLKISKSIGTVVKPQKGYVPPPLVGIWSRWPYFHNNSAPTLYDVISLPDKRAKTYIAVEAKDKNLDFDQIKNGYPSPQKIRREFATNKDYFFNTRTKGLSNSGHMKMLIDEQGREILDHNDKLDLIEFLKTL